MNSKAKSSEGVYATYESGPDLVFLEVKVISKLIYLLAWGAG
jgi:hypothetical protein